MDEMNQFMAGQGKEVKAMAGVVRALGWDVEVLKVFLGTAARVGGSDVGGLFGGAVTGEVDEAQRLLSGRVQRNGEIAVDDARKPTRVRSHVVKSRYRLGESAKIYVRGVLASQAYVEFADVRSAEMNPHPVLRTFKSLMDVELWRMVPKNKRVLEVGPNMVVAVRREPKVGMYLGLVPLVTSLDLERDVTAKGSLTVMLRRGSAVKPAHRAAAEDALLGYGSKLFARCLLQGVKWPCDVVVGLDSFYDIHIEEAISAMHRNGASMLVGSLVNVFDGMQGYWCGEDIIEGRVGQTEQLWRADRGKDSVEFYFHRSATRPYQHSLSKLASWFRHSSRVFSVGGSTYVFRVLPRTNEVIYAFTVVRVDTQSSEADAVPTYTFRGNEREVCITTCAADVRYPKGNPNRFAPVSVYVGSDSFSRVLQERLIRGKGRVEDIMRFARTNRVNIVHNGVRVSCENPISLDSLRWFATAVDELGDQMDRTALRDQEFVRRHMDSGGWVTGAQVEAARPGVARYMWARLVGSMAETLPVTAESTVTAIQRDNDTVRLEASRVKCIEMREIQAVLAGDRGALDAEERRACEAWLQYAEDTGPCVCLSCVHDIETQTDDADGSDDSTSDGDCFYDATESSHSTTTLVDEAILTGVEVHDIGPGACVQGPARVAAEEYLEILGLQVDAKESQARANCERMVNAGGITMENLVSLATERVKHYGIVVGRMGLVERTIGKLAMGDITHVYDPMHCVFYDAERDPDGRVWLPHRASSVCYTNDDMLIWIYPQLMLTVQRVLADAAFGALPRRIPFINGIWGAGKTFLAKKWFRRKQLGGKNVMFVGASRDPTDVVREELFGTDRLGKEAVRTFGSLLSRPAGARADTVVFDEVCVEHAAELFIALWLLKPSEFWACGDFKQMHYVPFVAGFRPKHETFVQAADVAMLIRGHRVPKDVYAAGLEVYGFESGIHPCDCKEHNRGDESLSVQRISSIAEVPVEAETAYLSFGQSVKEKMRSRIKCELGVVNKVVNTMAEFQGGTAGRVRVVRDVVPAKKSSIFHELVRANVGVSRSTGLTTYHTCSVEQDMMVRLIAASKSVRNRDKVEENIMKYGGEPPFGVEELEQFIAGTLPSSHSAIVAGKILKESMKGL